MYATVLASSAFAVVMVDNIHHYYVFTAVCVAKLEKNYVISDADYLLLVTVCS